MTPTVPETIILEALTERLRTFVANPALTVVYPGDVVGAPAQKYISTRFFPNDTVRMGIESDAPHRHYGLFQMTVHWPIGDSELYPRQVAGELASWFGADTRMWYGTTVVRSTKRPTVAQTVPEDGETTTRVTVEYECYT